MHENSSASEFSGLKLDSSDEITSNKNHIHLVIKDLIILNFFEMVRNAKSKNMN